LERLRPKDWARWATVTGAGKTLQRSVLFYAEWLATHERSHVEHFERMFNSKHPADPRIRTAEKGR
jgi:hypothetical protein